MNHATRAKASAALALAVVSLGMVGTVAIPTAGADDRTCTNTSANTTVCSRPGGKYFASSCGL